MRTVTENSRAINGGAMPPMFGPAWPRLPWSGNSGRYRFPMHEWMIEKTAVRIEALWCLGELSDDDRRHLLLAARRLQGANQCLYTAGDVLPAIVAQVDAWEIAYGLVETV